MKILFFNLKLILVFVCAIYLQGCIETKEEDDPDRNVILIKDESFFPLEIAQLHLDGHQVGQGTFDGSIGNEQIKIIAYDSIISFLIPDLGVGDYTLETTINNNRYRNKITIKKNESTNNIAQVYGSVINMNKINFDGLISSADLLNEDDKEIFQRDLIQINGWLQNLSIDYDKLSDIEKQRCAYILANNKWWLDEINEAVKVLNNSNEYLINNRVSNVQFSIEDYEKQVEAAMNAFVISTAVLKSHIPKIVVLTSMGSLLGGPIGAAVGGGIAIGNFLLALKATMMAQEHLLNTAFIPFQNLTSMRVASPVITFQDNNLKALTTTMTYRSVHDADNNANIPVVQSLINGIMQIKVSWEKIESYLPTQLQSPKTLDKVKTFKTADRYVHSDYLSVTEINNENVKLITTRKQDGKLNLTFRNISITDQKFDFTIEYKNPKFGDISQNMTAEINSDVYKLIYVSGNGQTYGGGGMPRAMIFRIYNETQQKFVSSLNAEGLSLKSSASIGYEDGAFVNRTSVCDFSEICFAGYYYIPPDVAKPFDLNITVTLRKHETVLLTYPITQYIR